MSAMVPAPVTAAAEDDSLQAQIKLLVKTEHQLHRSQSALDRQLMRVELLSHFALRWDSQSSTVDILADAAALFRRLFAVDRVAVVVDEHMHPPCGDARRALVAPVPAWLLTQALDGVMAPAVAEAAGFSADLRRLLLAVDVLRADDGAGRLAVVMPLRVGDDTPMCMVASCGDVKKASHIREAPSASARPFLQLMSSHVEHTLRNARLLADLEQVQHRLLRAQSQLEERVVQRTAELTREIAERKRTEAELILAMAAAEQASVAKSAFLANMSHELRTPLNAIIGYSELLAEDAEPAVKGDLDRIRDAGRRLLHIVSAMLDIARIEAGRVGVELEAVDVVAFVADAVAAVRDSAAAKGLILTAAVETGVASVVTDRAKLAQVVATLLGNAVKFTERGRVELQVGARQESDRDGVVLAVRDSGIGITADQLARLFQDFTQADESTTRRFGGTGLGLAISRRLCALIGGRVAVESAFGVGSTFSVWVPRVPTGYHSGTAAERVSQPAAAAECVA